MTEWRVVQAVAPNIIWARYASAVGLDKMKETFGEHWPPPSARPGETVFTFRDPDEPVVPFDPTGHPAGWLSLTLNQFNPSICHMSRGVWPEYHRRGLGRDMRAWAERWCREHGVEALSISVYATNHLHLANVMQDDYWQLDAVEFNPPGFVFVHLIDAEEVPAADA